MKKFTVTREILARCFAVGVLGSAALFWVTMLLTRCANINAYFVADHTNTSMDYFNMLAVLRYGDPYHDGANYPAFCFVIWKIMYHLLPKIFTDTMPDGFVLRTNMIAQLGYIMFSLIGIATVWETVRGFVKGGETDKRLFASAVLISGPMLFLLECGNIMLIVLASMLIFLKCYRSPEKKIRWIGYISLGIAAALKIYPAVFGLLILRGRNRREAVGVVLMGLLIFTVPFFAFNGVDSVLDMLRGISIANGNQLGSGLGYNFSADTLVLLFLPILIFFYDYPGGVLRKAEISFMRYYSA